MSEKRFKMKWMIILLVAPALAITFFSFMALVSSVDAVQALGREEAGVTPSILEHQYELTDAPEVRADFEAILPASRAAGMGEQANGGSNGRSTNDYSGTEVLGDYLLISQSPNPHPIHPASGP